MCYLKEIKKERTFVPLFEANISAAYFHAAALHAVSVLCLRGVETAVEIARLERGADDVDFAYRHLVSHLGLSLIHI